MSDDVQTITAAGYLPPVTYQDDSGWSASTCRRSGSTAPLYGVADTEAEAVAELALRCSHRSES